MCKLFPWFRSPSSYPSFFSRLQSVHAIIRDFSNDNNADGNGNAIIKIREKPKGAVRMAGGKQVDALRSGPTWVVLILNLWVFAFVSSALLTLNKPWYKFLGTLKTLYHLPWCTAHCLLWNVQSNMSAWGSWWSKIKYRSAICEYNIILF